MLGRGDSNKHVDRFFGATEIELLRDFIRVYTGNISISS